MKRKALAALAVTALVVAWALVLRPAFLGGPASYILVAGNSMEPVLSSGDLAVLRQRHTYNDGDVVAFKVPEGEPGQGAVVIHRIAGGTAEDGFIMQGDNKDRPDQWRPTADDIEGKMWFHMPGVGRFLAFLRAPLVLAGLASGFAVFLVLSGGEEKKRPRELSPAKRPDRPRRLRLPPGLALWLLLIILTATLVASLAFTARH